MNAVDLDKTQRLVFQPQQFPKPQAALLRSEVESLRFELAVYRGAIIGLMAAVLWLI